MSTADKKIKWVTKQISYKELVCPYCGITKQTADSLGHHYSYCEFSLQRKSEILKEWAKKNNVKVNNLRMPKND